MEPAGVRYLVGRKSRARWERRIGVEGPIRLFEFSGWPALRRAPDQLLPRRRSRVRGSGPPRAGRPLLSRRSKGAHPAAIARLLAPPEYSRGNSQDRTVGGLSLGPDQHA